MLGVGVPGCFIRVRRFKDVALSNSWRARFLQVRISRSFKCPRQEPIACREKHRGQPVGDMQTTGSHHRGHDKVSAMSCWHPGYQAIGSHIKTGFGRNRCMLVNIADGRAKSKLVQNSHAGPFWTSRLNPNLNPAQSLTPHTLQKGSKDAQRA